MAGENLGGGHHAGLASVVDGKEHGQQGHQGLARAYVALHKAVHLPAGVHVVAYLAHHALLRAGESERQALRIKRVEPLPHPGES